MPVRILLAVHVKGNEMEPPNTLKNIHREFNSICTLAVGIMLLNASGLVYAQTKENWVKLSSGVPKQIARNTAVVGGFISVPSDQGNLTVTVANALYVDLYGNSSLGVYDILGRLGSTPRGTYPGTILVPDPGVIEFGALLPLHIQNPAPGDYFVAAYSFYKDEIVSSYTITATYLPMPPVISSQPQSRTVRAGDSLSFGVTATGQSLSYQWYKNNTAIGGANGAVYMLSHVQIGDAGNYQVRVTNPGGSQTSAQATLTVTVDVTVQPNPSTRSFAVDGTTYATSQTFTWVSGSSHTISSSSPQSGSMGVQYLWSGWSDNGAIAHTVAPTSGTTYTVNFTTQYYLTMSVGMGGTANPNSGWNNSGASIPIKADENEGFVFTTWTGTGNGSYSGDASSDLVTMNGPITETASFMAIPPLRIIAVQQAGNIVLSWPTNAVSLTLECTTNLQAANWEPVSPAPVIVSGQYTVTNPISWEKMFFRLTK
jgi:hypothetical protein